MGVRGEEIFEYQYSDPVSVEFLLPDGVLGVHYGFLLA